MIYYLYQEPEACGFTYTLTVNIDNDKAFGAAPNSEKVTQPTCNNGRKGAYEITAQKCSYYLLRK